MMKSEKKIRFPFLMAQAVLGMALLAGAVMTCAQAPKPIQGTITVLVSNTRSVKSDADVVTPIEVPSTAAILRIAPGAKDLSTAAKILFSDLAVGDRVLVTPDPKATGASVQALRIIAMKQSALGQKQQKDREDWQLRGVGGPVKSVDVVAGVIVLSSGSGATAKTITVHTTKATVLKRYAPASVRYDEAKPASIDAIHAGDQLRARGAKSADGTELAAEETISGSFRNIAGTVVSLDAAGATLVVKDLTTKKPVTIKIAAETQMLRLEDRMAQMLAIRLKGSAVAGLGRVLKELRLDPGLRGSFHHGARRPADANQQIHAPGGAPPGVSANPAVQFFPCQPKFQHFAEHGDTPRGGSFPQHVQHGLRGLRVRVVAIVPDDDAPMHSTLAAHVAHGEAGNGRAQALRRDLEDMGDGRGAQRVHPRVPPRLGVLKTHAETAEAGAGRRELHLFGAHLRPLGEAEGDGSAAVY